MRRYTPIAWGLALALGSSMAASVQAAPPLPTPASSSSAIPAMPLKRALNLFAQREHLQVVYVSGVADGAYTRGAQAGLSQRSTLHTLLRGTGLQFRYLNPNTVTISPAEKPKAADPPPATPSSTSPQHEPQRLQAIVVTGSLIPRVDVETANPVLTVSQEQIAATGDLTLGQLMQDLPVMTGSAENPQHHGGHGNTQISMRGLGPARTLILVDGRRVISSDVSSIPVAMIERIEVLKNGASVVYGSDAIGGVVNFITKKHYQGVQFTSQFGVSQRLDAQQTGASLTVGHVSDKGSFIGGVGYNKQDGVLAGARPWTANTVDLEANKQGVVSASVGGSTNSAYGHIEIPDSGPVHDAFADCDSGYLARNPDASGMDPINDYHCYLNFGPNSDQYNFATQDLDLKPQERVNAFLNGTYDLTDNVSVYLDAYFNNTRASFQEAPATYHTPQVTISADNYYNPFGVEFGRHGYSYRSRLLGLGNRGANYNTTIAQFTAGVMGSYSMFAHHWNWDAGMSFGHDSEQTVTFNYPNVEELYTGPSFLDPATGKVTCGTPANADPDCDAGFNPFNVESADSSAALHRHSVSAHRTAYAQERIWHAQTNGGLLDLPAGTVQLAVGATYRQEHTHTLVGDLQILDPVTDSCGIGTGCTAPIQGGYNVRNFFGELFVPILSNLPWAYGLNVTIGDRYSKFSTFGSTNNKEFKVEWRPVESLLLRGSVEEVFRAPTVGDVFGPIESADPKITFDPCDGYTGNPVDPACVNVPTDGSFVDEFVAQNVETSIKSGGAKVSGFPIGPETGKSFDVGVVYSPPWVQGLTVSADVWHVYLHDIITQVGLSNMLSLCSAGQMDYCALIHRFSSGPQQGQIDPDTIEPVGNLGIVRTGGVDLSADYKLNAGHIGRFDFDVNTTYLKYYDAETAPGTNANTVFHYAGHYMGVGSAPAADCPGQGQCLFPRWRANVIVIWNLGNWSASWKLHYLSGFRMGSPAPSQDTHPAGSHLDGYYIDFGAFAYSNLSLGYDIVPLHTKLLVGVRNLFDRDPPLFYENNASYGQGAMNFDLLGRYYWARAVVSF